MPYFFIKQLELSSDFFKDEKAEGSFTGFPVDQANVFFADEEQGEVKGERLTLDANGTPGRMTITLDEDNSRHAIQVLRMKAGDQMHLTDGKGHLLTCTVTNDHKKHCEVQVDNLQSQKWVGPEVTVAIALTKNTSRFEWFLEKAAELGISRVVPLITQRTEKQKFKEERLQNILVSAMLQSQQNWLLKMSAPIAFSEFIGSATLQAISNKYIAHCVDGEKRALCYQEQPSLILIGPEGDFTSEEIAVALASGYNPVTLGATRLRTETAGMVAAALLRVG